MKTVFGSHANTAHVWAQHNTTISHGRSADGRMIFNTNTIYSYGYHFPIAKFHKAKDNSLFVLFTTNTRSVSTAKHKSHVLHALNYGKLVPTFHVENVDCLESEAVKAYYESRISEHLERAPKRRNPRLRQWDLSEAIKLAEEANKLAKLIGVRWQIKLPSDMAELLEHARKETERKAAAAKRADAKRAREMLTRDKEYIERWRAGQVDDLPTPDGMRQARNAQLFTAADYELAEKRLADAWEQWRKHERQSAPDRGNENARLRLSSDSSEIETSAGASFPTEHGRKAWPLLKRLKAAGQTWQRNGQQIHLGHFHIDSVAADGSVTAGCHKVAFAEYERIAKELGLD